MNAVNRLPLRLLFGVFLAFGLNPPIARGQPPGIQTPVKIPPVVGETHHIMGQLEKGTWPEGCPNPALTGVKLIVVESWCVLKDEQLVIPVDPANGNSDPLSFNNKPLLQKHILAETTLTGEKNFDIHWAEANPLSRVSWAKNVQNGRTGQSITVYRVLSLRTGVLANQGSVSLNPVPVVMFWGAETVKNVGTIRVDCTFLND
jgi:hypothetical protein